MKKLLIIPSLLAIALSCNYLDVVPPEKADLDDMMTNNTTVLNNLYSCYGYIQNSGLDPRNDSYIDGGGTDECVEPQEWGNWGSLVQYNTVTPVYANGKSDYPWKVCYDAIGYCNLFLKQIEELKPDITPADKAQYIAEVQFLKAYYHYRVLAMYGPCPIIDQMASPNISKEDLPGRCHFDYCVNYIVNLLDDAAASLPSVDPSSSYKGRATSVICKALKARVLLLAASPMWNGSFPHRTWENTNFETPGYGKKLVSLEYDAAKWTRARNAAKAAIQAARDAGCTLFGIDESEILRVNQGVPLPAVPGKGDTGADEVFRQRVMMLRYMMTTRSINGNKETIWGISQLEYHYRMASPPHYILNTDIFPQGYGAWGGLSPTLHTVQHFYTEKGLIPEEDASFTPKSQWYESAGLTQTDIIKLNVGREPRFYAWISFDGDEYSPVIAARQPLICHMRDPEQGGYNSVKWGTRNYCITGYLNKKWVHPNYYYTGVGRNQNSADLNYPSALIRLAELYLILAECDAHLEQNVEGLEYLNLIRARAGVPEWTLASLSAANKTLLDAVMEERFVELYMEGHRFYDIRRYVKGRECMSKENFKGLDAVRTAPTFEQFNTPVDIPQPIEWHDRQYLMPVAASEVYANPQMVQAPLY